MFMDLFRLCFTKKQNKLYEMSMYIYVVLFIYGFVAFLLHFSVALWWSKILNSIGIQLMHCYSNWVLV